MLGRTRNGFDLPFPFPSIHCTLSVPFDPLHTFPYSYRATTLRSSTTYQRSDKGMYRTVPYRSFQEKHFGVCTRPQPANKQTNNRTLLRSLYAAAGVGVALPLCPCDLDLFFLYMCVCIYIFYFIFGGGTRLGTPRYTRDFFLSFGLIFVETFVDDGL